ncbi:uncharacterized protein I303_101997 [Kwoniella dejecticola CBS 10117]|uniref:Condensin complex subunit 2 n=1 Tax=Kwoniella dejecticola CBS 10117 TaxID=1296121 RepID=A0AAJ8KKX1_9TREE
MPTAVASPSSISNPRSKAATKKSSGSTTASPAESPLQPSRMINAPRKSSGLSMSVNDDAAEKAKRRKSAHFGDIAAGGGEPKERSHTGINANGKRTVSALAVQQAAAGGQTMAQRRAKRLSAVEPAAPVISMEVMNTNFEEWMKLATDNKINANNSWNFALIDYFADLTLLRNGPDDQSINFQKASCTLDGCIKIYTSRVDSVATETGKLLSGLAGGGAAEDAEGEDADGDEEEGGEPKATRKTTSRSEATLAKSFAQLQVKKFDLEFTVDPLFKKTCADFDEGGAMGLLMNHLGVDGKGRVVFDAGDAGADEDEEEEERDDDEEMVDLEKLREYVPSIEAVQDLYISDTLQTFRFSSDPDSVPDFTTLLGLKDSFNDDESRPVFEEDGYGSFPAPALAGDGEVHDFFGDENFDAGPSGGFDDGASMAGDDMDAQDAYSGPGMGGSLAMAGPGEHLGPFDPRRQAGSGELVMAFSAGNDDAEGMFDYFDKGLGKAWAGADHWKLRKVAKRVDANAAAGGSTAATKTAKAAKASFTIDFASPSTTATSSKTLFAPASKSSISLPSNRASASKSSRKTSAVKRREEWLLPDDMHFSSRQLLRLFLKPKFSLRMRKSGTASRMAENANGEIDENFWAQAAADRADDNMADGMDMDSQPPPFETQFFHDDVDDAYVDDALDVVDAANMYDANEANDLLQGSQNIQLKKSRPENVNFAKKAKRVDVKRLKDDIWTGLRSLVPAEKDNSEDEIDAPKTPDEIEPVKTFDNIITSLRSSYPSDKMSEISTSFCFICLLHLANEEGLKIETARYDGKDDEDVGCQGFVEDYEGDGESSGRVGQGRKLDEGERKDRIVGELQALKVYKDHNAGRAA